jgi:hypothetical protein
MTANLPRSRYDKAVQSSRPALDVGGWCSGHGGNRPGVALPAH